MKTPLLKQLHQQIPKVVFLVTPSFAANGRFEQATAGLKLLGR
jgi:hypothetical protein